MGDLARMAEMADAPDLGSGSERSVGSSPIPRTTEPQPRLRRVALRSPGRRVEKGRAQRQAHIAGVKPKAEVYAQIKRQKAKKGAAQTDPNP